MFESDPELFRDLNVSEKAWRRKERNSPTSEVEYLHNRNNYLKFIGQNNSKSTRKNSGNSTLVSQIENQDLASNTDAGENKSTGIQPLLSFKSGDFRSNPKSTSPQELTEGEVLKKHGRVGKHKLLIDVSDANLCQVCGCSAFRKIFAGRREAQCGNCLHVHSNI